jgi:hypothetical protein
MGLLSILQQECRQNESEEQKEQVSFWKILKKCAKETSIFSGNLV